MTTHRLNLHPEPFAAIVSGRKTIESRLYAEKCRKIQLGDRIIFANSQHPSQTITATVVGSLRYGVLGIEFEHES